ERGLEMRWVLLAAVLALMPQMAHATSGFGCYRVNVGPSDPLAIRAKPSASAQQLGAADWANAGIIALRGLPRGEDVQPSLFEVHNSEFSLCTPTELPLGARWCPVSVFDGDQQIDGWIKRRFVDHSECP
ncbi:MAG: hypothetical protein AAFW98_14380, partial [Pseudomonadota bacterium]